MTTKNNEKLTVIDKQIEELKTKKKALLLKEKEKKKQAHEKLLIDLGKVLESMEIDTLEKAQNFKETFSDLVQKK